MDLTNSSSFQTCTSPPKNGKSTIIINKVCTAARATLHTLTTTSLSLLLPLSFLILARLATAHYLFSIDTDNLRPLPSMPFLCSLFLYTKKTTILHLLVSLISISSVAELSTSKTKNILCQSPEPIKRRRLYAAWIVLAIVQVCVGVGIEGSIAAGIDGSSFDREGYLLCKVMFFMGLHETTLFWLRTVVKPVVDDTIFGVSMAESWVEKAVVGLFYGWLWWGRLREEVEALAAVPELKRELMVGIGVADFVGWWLYYLMVTIGMVRMIKGLNFTVRILTRRIVKGGSPANDEKV